MQGSVSMDIVDQFVHQYTKEQDYYISVCAIAQRQLQGILEQSGIRAIVTARAKAPDRLEAKLRQRHLEKNYQSHEDVYDDIVDFAGVRVALYFPKDIDRVENLIKEYFHCINQNEFPKKQPDKTAYKKRFSGYRARHFHVMLKTDFISKTEEHYSSARIEIQVASVLMHAWSEVEHDLAYKPMQGELSTTEYSILDELNGLVLAGEIALERLQDAMDIRISAPKNEFSNSYELASYLASNIHGALEGEDQLFGDVRTLFQLLKATKLNTPQKLKALLSVVDIESDIRTISEQIIDQVIYSDKKGYEMYRSIIKKNRALKFAEDNQEDSIDDLRMKFLNAWIELETKLRKKLSVSSKKTSYSSYMSTLNNLLKRHFSPKDAQDYMSMKKLRDEIIHGALSSESNLTKAQLESKIATLKTLTEKLDSEV